MSHKTLVILAAGMGSRYGGLKQIEPIDGYGHKLIDFSIYDAKRAGFNKVVFIIKKEHFDDFRLVVGDAVSKHLKVEYVFQDIENVPQWVKIPDDRIKPWGTAHAMIMCKDVVREPFAIINSDDYYGVDAYFELHRFLEENKGNRFHYAMVGFLLKNTLSEYGYVTRGITEVDNEGFAKTIDECMRIKRNGEFAEYESENGQVFKLSLNTPVSMNMWAFYPNIFDLVERQVFDFFKNELSSNPLKAECYIPVEMDKLIQSKEISVKVLRSNDPWFGMTYNEDRAMVAKKISELKAVGIYPERLWL